MKTIITAVLLIFVALRASAQPSRVLSDEVRTLQVVANDNQLAMPVIALADDQWVDIDFDVLSHEYRHLTYKIEHCTANWDESSDLFESEFLEGFDNEVIEDYEKSRNTSVLYTHYHLTLPNDDVQMRLSGNYRVKILDEDEETVLAEACFMIVEPQASVRATMTTRTDKDLNGRHQQIEYEVGYGALKVVDPYAELQTIVVQNRRWDNRVVNPEPNLQNQNSIGFTHRRELIFDAGAECHKFELLDKHKPSLGVDHIEFHAPYEHAVLNAVPRVNTYTYDEDNNGAFIIRNSRGDEFTESEYMWVHFALECDRLPANERVYVQGDFTHGALLPQCEMTYDEANGMYECAVLLKQGYYEYRFVSDKSGTALTEGDFYETRNEYTIFVYHRERGGRYDRLVGIATL